MSLRVKACGAVEAAWCNENLMQKVACWHCIFNRDHTDAGIIICTLPLALSTASCAAHKWLRNSRLNSFGSASSLSVIHLKSYLSLKTQSQTDSASQNTQTLHQLLVFGIYSSVSYSPVGKWVWLWDFIDLICNLACTSPTGDWYLETSEGQKQFEFWRSWKTHQLHRRSMWINISHNPEALEPRTEGKTADRA